MRDKEGGGRQDHSARPRAEDSGPPAKLSKSGARNPATREQPVRATSAIIQATEESFVSWDRMDAQEELESYEVTMRNNCGSGYERFLAELSEIGRIEGSMAELVEIGRSEALLQNPSGSVAPHSYDTSHGNRLEDASITVSQDRESGNQTKHNFITYHHSIQVLKNTKHVSEVARLKPEVARHDQYQYVSCGNTKVWYRSGLLPLVLSLSRLLVCYEPPSDVSEW
ncbi:uncharacterized protein UDID_18659 [Ustilago sp. UG-2017a]|nr:uncharacterized protein UDID_18659 [Ustilago sp. UG-2017a]